MFVNPSIILFFEKTEKFWEFLTKLLGKNDDDNQQQTIMIWMMIIITRSDDHHQKNDVDVDGTIFRSSLLLSCHQQHQHLPRHHPNNWLWAIDYYGG